MDSIEPSIAADTRTVAKTQGDQGYVPVRAVFATHPDYPRSGTSHNSVIMAFRPSPTERQAIANGADIYVALLTFGRPQQPIIVTAGKELMARIYQLFAI